MVKRVVHATGHENPARVHRTISFIFMNCLYLHMVCNQEKFRVKSELDLFRLLQNRGKLSDSAVAKHLGIGSTTANMAYQRLRERGFFDIHAVPRLDRFQETPMGLIAFADLSPVAASGLASAYRSSPFVRLIIEGKGQMVLLVIEESVERLTQLLFEMMNRVEAKPCLYILPPRIRKCDLRIPDQVLLKIYGGLPDRRRGARPRLSYRRRRA